MKKYTTPAIEVELLDERDIVICSFGELEDLLSSGDTPNINAGENIWGW